MSQFTTRKIPDMKSVQVSIKLLNTLKINSKNIFYIMGHIYLETKDMNIRKKSI